MWNSPGDQKWFVFLSRQVCIQIIWYLQNQKLIWYLQNQKLGTTNYCSTLNFRTTGFRKDLWNSGGSAIATSQSPLWDSHIFVWSRSGPLCAHFCMSARVTAAARTDYGVSPGCYTLQRGPCGHTHDLFLMGIVALYRVCSTRLR